jgi:hypothetical protein
MTDKAWIYVKSRAMRQLLAKHQIRHLTTKPYRPPHQRRTRGTRSTAASNTTRLGGTRSVARTRQYPRRCSPRAHRGNQPTARAHRRRTRTEPSRVSRRLF